MGSLGSILQAVRTLGGSLLISRWKEESNFSAAGSWSLLGAADNRKRHLLWTPKAVPVATPCHTALSTS